MMANLAANPPVLEGHYLNQGDNLPTNVTLIPETKGEWPGSKWLDASCDSQYITKQKCTSTQRYVVLPW